MQKNCKINTQQMRKKTSEIRTSCTEPAFFFTVLPKKTTVLRGNAFLFQIAKRLIFFAVKKYEKTRFSRAECATKTEKKYFLLRARFPRAAISPQEVLAEKIFVARRRRAQFLLPNSLPLFRGRRAAPPPRSGVPARFLLSF